MTDLSESASPGECSVLLVSASANGHPGAPAERPAAPSFLACSERLPRDLLVRLAALSRQLGDLRAAHAASVELALHLEDVAAGLDAVIRSIHDETVQHFAARRV
ncbi:MAG: hypothetical protein KY461_08705 [Actinobacteria bacterium]|nr:hypothetical protein [Actinomycetota bacterium]